MSIFLLETKESKYASAGLEPTCAEQYLLTGGEVRYARAKRAVLNAFRERSTAGVLWLERAGQRQRRRGRRHHRDQRRQRVGAQRHQGLDYQRPRRGLRRGVRNHRPLAAGLQSHQRVHRPHGQPRFLPGRERRQAGDPRLVDGESDLGRGAGAQRRHAWS